MYLRHGVNLSKGYIMFLMIENELKDDGQFKECIQKIHQNKARLLESVSFMKALESQWLCLGAFYSYDGAAQCNCDACNNFAITGIENLKISDTLCDPEKVEALPPLSVDEPTVSMAFRVNDSPFAGREGKFITSRNIKERLDKELISNDSN